MATNNALLGEEADTIFNWVTCLGANSTEDVLQELELRTEGSNAERCHRLYKWLTGRYEPEDFVRSQRLNEKENRLKRESLRAEFIARTLEGGRTSVPAQTADEQAKTPEERSANERVSPRINLTERGVDQNEKWIDAQNENKADSDRLHGAPEDAIRLMETLKLIREELAEIKLGNVELRRGFRSQQEELDQVRLWLQSNTQSSTSGPMSSRRVCHDRQPPDLGRDELSIEDMGSQTNRVNFQNTFSYHRYSSSSPITTPASARIRELRELVAAAQSEISTLCQEAQRAENASVRVVGGDNRPEEINSTLMTMKIRDVGSIVRKWNLKFQGHKTDSIDYLLTRIEECRATAGLSESEVLGSLSEILTGVAAVWYRNNRHKWNTWEQFATAARNWYGTEYFQQKLRSEAEARTQGGQEPVRDYLTKLQSYLVKIVPRLSEEEEVNLMVRNMLPHLQRLVLTDDVRDLQTLHARATQAETLLALEKTFRPPPPPDMSLMPHLAYNAKENVESSGTNVAATTTQPMAKSESTSNKALDKVVKMLENLTSIVTKGQQNNQNQPYKAIPPDRGKVGEEDQS